MDDLLVFHTGRVERPVVVKVLTIINITEAVPHQVAVAIVKKQKQRPRSSAVRREREAEQPGRLSNVCASVHVDTVVYIGG